MRAKNLPRVITASFIAVLLWAPGATLAGVMVIGHPSLPTNSITPEQARNLFLGKTDSIDGTKVTPVDQASGNSARAGFYAKIANKNTIQMKAYWAKIIFTGRGVPPKAMGGDGDVRQWVAATPNAIGYIDSSAVNNSVKVLLSLQ